MASEDIFTRVESQGDKYRVFNHIVAHKVSVSGQTDGGTTFSLGPVNLRGNFIVGKINSSSPIHPADFISIKLQVGDENFFVRTRFSEIRDGQAVLDISEPLYKLQRREYYRVKLTQLENTVFDVMAINGEPCDFSLPLADLSGGGFAVDLTDRKIHGLPKGTIVIGKIVIPNRMNEVICGEIRYETETELPSGAIQMRVGFQFKDIASVQLQRLMQVVFDIHREFFSRFDSFRLG